MFTPERECDKTSGLDDVGASFLFAGAMFKLNFNSVHSCLQQLLFLLVTLLPFISQL